MTRLVYTLLTGSLLWGSTALAQDATAEQAGTRGPMTLERVQTGFVVAPEVKVTDFDNSAGVLVGATAGVAVDESFLIGAGGYWLANGEDDRKLGYGGLVLQWLGGLHAPFGVGVRGLLGFGTATVRTEFDIRRLADRNRVALFQPRISENVVIAEPEVDFSMRVNERLRVNWSLGYRFVGSELDLEDRLQGATGGVALRIKMGN